MRLGTASLSGITAGMNDQGQAPAADSSYAEYKLLDHGYLKLIDVWGSDQRIIEAARMSTNRGFISWEPYRRCEACDEVQIECVPKTYGPCLLKEDHDWKEFPRGDMGILAYLWKNAHATPFEMAGMTIEVQAPIFVFREWQRHRTQGFNELSARYTPMPDLNYVPTVERLLMGGGHLTKQAGTVAGAKPLDEAGALLFQEVCRAQYIDAEREYQAALAYGVSKELARVIIPVGRFSRMRATANLRNWLGFNKLRLPATAQWEIRQYAGVVDQIIHQLFPRTHAVAYEAP